MRSAPACILTNLHANVLTDALLLLFFPRGPFDHYPSIVIIENAKNESVTDRPTVVCK